MTMTKTKAIRERKRADVKKKTPTIRETKRLRKEIWENITGCDCNLAVQGPGQHCTKRAVRCNGRLKRIHKDLAKHGLQIFPSSP